MITAKPSFFSPVDSLQLSCISASISNYFCRLENDKVHAVYSAWTFVHLICLVSVGAETEYLTWCGNQQFFNDSQSIEKPMTKLTWMERTIQKEKEILMS